LLAENRLAEAEREVTEAVSLTPGDSEAHLVLGQVYEAQRRDREAVAELETSLHLKATPAVHLLLARIYLSLGQPEAAREHGQAALDLDPHNREAESWIKAAKAAIRSSASKKAP
jgi:Tfp pilus assembly protein PilF